MFDLFEFVSRTSQLLAKGKVCMCNFRVGQKVVCVSLEENAQHAISRESAKRFGAIYPQVGRVYTVRSIYETQSGLKGILLCELDNMRASQRAGRERECGFVVNWFRPVADRKTDISIFKAMLNPSKCEVRA